MFNAAAGLGRRLYGDENKELPKALLEFDGKTLLHRHINTLLELGMTELTIVVGHGKDALKTEAFAAAPEGAPGRPALQIPEAAGEVLQDRVRAAGRFRDALRRGSSESNRDFARAQPESGAVRP